MGRRTTSIKLSNEIRELLHKLALHTGKQKSEIIEKAILEFIKNHYPNLLTKGAEEMIKEEIEKSLSSIQEKKREENIEKWRRILLEYISYNIMKTKLLYDYFFNPSNYKYGIPVNEFIPIQLYSLKSYERQTILSFLKTTPEIKDFKIINMLIRLFKELNEINLIIIKKDPWKIDHWKLLEIMDDHLPKPTMTIKSSALISYNFDFINLIEDNSLGLKQKFTKAIRGYLHNKIKFENIRIWHSEAHQKLIDIIIGLFMDNLDYYFKSFIERVNKENNTDFKNINELFEYTQQLINKDAYIEEYNKIRKAIILDFIKYLKKLKKTIEKNNLPKISPNRFVMKRIQDYINNSQILTNVIRVKKIYSDFFNSITKEFLDNITEDIENKVISYIMKRFSNRLKREKTRWGVLEYYDINERDIESIKEDLKRILILS